MSFFSEMDTKQKVLLIGGGGIVAFFLLKSLMGRGNTASVPSVVDQGKKIQEDLGNQVAGAVSNAAEVFGKQNAEQYTNLQKLVGGFQDNQAKTNDALFSYLTTSQMALQQNQASMQQSLIESQASMKQNLADSISGFLAIMAKPPMFQTTPKPVNFIPVSSAPNPFTIPSTSEEPYTQEYESNVYYEVNDNTGGWNPAVGIPVTQTNTNPGGFTMDGIMTNGGNFIPGNFSGLEDSIAVWIPGGVGNVMVSKGTALPEGSKILN